MKNQVLLSKKKKKKPSAVIASSFSLFHSNKKIKIKIKEEKVSLSAFPFLGGASHCNFVTRENCQRATEYGFWSPDLGLNPSCLPSPPNSQRHIFIKRSKATSSEQEPSDPTQLHPLSVGVSVLPEPTVPMVQEPVSRRHLFH